MTAVLIAAALLAALAPGPTGAQAQRSPVILSTTTSTQDSGLLDVLVPMFERQSGYTVKTVVAGFEVTGLSIYRDHHAFTPGEARRELARAAADDACLLVTTKDAVRWPAAAGDARVRVLEVEWEWVHGGEAVERLVFEGEEGG